MENQESGNLSTINDYDDLGNLIYYDDDDDGGSGGDREKNKITKPCKPSLINYRNIAYNILKYLKNDMVKNKEIQKLGQCTECKKVVLNSPVIPEEGSPSDPMNVDPNGNVALINVLLSDREQRSFKTTGIAKKTSNQATNPDNRAFHWIIL
ncbi:uncharacterized protein OCT59_019538 [Rhizophagus irregularis]|uniref:Uncharacterized protein n=1 Tax=Rhizophagus irregularis (strain DAOM 181602 / DAOM 197198 / MUCL 43194) TaxID=747089 RepID=A0A2P4QDW9_RHIID|nr:hypothetical protein GLOIN_2v1475196 [Rhizophagus irregularis DAOM 181602=DAOM 197198]POG75820.1 hypothetical protein GLOIN_2v1475196 [Rhizophagus irregularis DAOM 181602=DAOM 197198]UZO27340.1 hypothetical protein OCT59_019538 [Rhizophagus irregularis]GBC51554.2 hypothetical protein GLOIN_2v1475196 [Rhizophagus irregularis DAOM 181602=DAOM 197198]|eukprot:XP_025182686.1 hypothetical protein GLOIN_2v1475196 [Rhizophagus irregularis DAOM 181602=DAOM 197198]